MENQFVQLFLSVLPRVFADADGFEGLHWHDHGIRQPDGKWRDLNAIFPYPEGMRAPDVCTLGVWSSVEDLRQFSYNGRTHPPSMKRLQGELDRSDGPSFVMWWAPASERVSLQQGWDKLVQLRTHGPSSGAFTLDSVRNQPKVA